MMSLMRPTCMQILQPTVGRWVLEIYRTLIACRGGIIWMYLVVFVLVLIAYVMMRGLELKRGKPVQQDNSEPSKDT
jgi:hypothetical protein